MKYSKLFLTLFFVALFTGCISVEEHNKDTLSRSKTLAENFSNRIAKVTFEGHEYIVYREVAGYGGFAAMTHSGTCPTTHN